MQRLSIFFIISIILILFKSITTLSLYDQIDEKEENTTLQILDATELMMTGNSEFDRKFYNYMIERMTQSNKDFLPSQNAAWKGFIQYFLSNGTASKSDYWDSCIDPANCHSYHEHNVTTISKYDIIIYEPCNYASNIAFYHSFTQIYDYNQWSMPSDYVQALEEGFLILAMGSAFWHGSHTYLGNVQDNRLIDVIAFVGHQASVLNLPTNSSIIHDLNQTPRSKSSPRSTHDLTKMLINDSVYEWKNNIQQLDMPQYFVTFSAIVIDMLTFSLPQWAVDLILGPLMNAFPLTDDVKQFINNKYLPEIRQASKKVKISFLQSFNLARKTVGTILKLLYAFLWQQWVFPSKFFMEPWVNKIGAVAMPYVNAVLNFITGFYHPDKDVQNSVNIYPGDIRCRVEEPHSKWHEQSANGLLDLMFLADYLHEITKEK